MKAKFVRIGIIAAIAALTFSLIGCNNQTEGSSSSVESNSEEQMQTYSVGETIETDIIKFTLDRAELAIALNSSMGFGSDKAPDGLAGGDFFLPKEYNADEDEKNPFVAAKGHTLVSMTFTVENLDRASVELCDWGLYEFITIEYNGASYVGESSSDDNFKTKIGAVNKNNEGWSTINTSQIYVYAGKTNSYKAYIDIPVEIENLSSPFEIIFNLPTSSGERQAFTYAVN